MNYKLFNINNITKFTLNDYYKDGGAFSLSSFFWSSVFDEKYFEKFIEEKYINFLNIKGINLNKSNFEFLISSLKRIKENINIKDEGNIKADYLFFSFVVFNKVLEIYNDYYKESDIKITLNKGVIFSFKSSENINEIYYDINSRYLTKNNQFLNDFIYPFLTDKFLNKDNKLAVSIKLFWPGEIVGATIIANFLKKNIKDSKIIFDLADSNEQVDYTQWKKFIKNKSELFISFFDFFIFYKDFGFSKKIIINYLNGNLNKNKLSNIVLYENGEIIEYPLKKDNPEDILDKFSLFVKNKKPSKLFGKNSIYTRLFPYKCYWNKCNFCTINSQNFVDYNKNYNYSFFIDNLIEKIKKDKIYSIVFSDEAMPPIQIVYFAKKIIENNLDIIYQFRTRFDKFYTKENCELLYKSGARYCGIGLESASERLNEEIGNKGEKDISIYDKLKIINNFDESGISFHNYSIIGFPTETLEETILTYNFWLESIKNFNFYTTTPNIFGLMRGSEIYKNPDKFGIEIIKSGNTLDLNYEFNYKNGSSRDLKLYKKVAEKIHKNQFTPWLIKKDFNDATGFWNFLDRSSYFYKLKVKNKFNPFIKYFNINKEILKKNLEEILKEKFILSIGIEITQTSNGIYLYDWINFEEFNLDINYKYFFGNFNDNLSLYDNLGKCNKEFMITLIENRILILKQ